MNFTSPFTRPPVNLADLIAGGEAYAQQRMQHYGHLNPAFLFLAEDGRPGAMFFQNGEFNEAQKAWFAETCRFAAIATGASACCLVLEVWVSAMKLPADIDPLTYRPDPMPSQDPLRHEIILLQGETREGTNSKALSIVRFDNRKFASLVPADFFDTSKGWEIGGQFSHVLTGVVKGSVKHIVILYPVWSFRFGAAARLSPA